jgi:hypothetical protein
VSEAAENYSIFGGCVRPPKIVRNFRRLPSGRRKLRWPPKVMRTAVVLGCFYFLWMWAQWVGIFNLVTWRKYISSELLSHKWTKFYFLVLYIYTFLYIHLLLLVFVFLLSTRGEDSPPESHCNRSWGQVKMGVVHPNAHRRITWGRGRESRNTESEGSYVG